MDVIILSLVCLLLFLQARSYIQSLSYKPKVPWERIFPSIVDPKGTCKHSVVHLNFNDQHPPYNVCDILFGLPRQEKKFNPVA